MYINTKQIVVSLVLLFLQRGPAGQVFAIQPDLTSEDAFYNEFEKVINSCHDQDFELALTTAKSLHQKYPDEPASTLALISVYQSITDCYRITNYNVLIDSLAQVSIKLSKQKIKSNKRNGIAYFCLASAYGTRSVSYSKQGRWLEAFRDGTRIKSNFEKSLKYDPQFYDAYYGLGLYNYWVASKSKVMRMLFTSKEKAIDQIKLAKTKGRFFKTTAVYGLSAIYYNEGEFEKAIFLCDSLANDYPENPTLDYRRGCIYEKQYQWQQAKTHFESLLAKLSETQYQSHAYKRFRAVHLLLR